MAQSSSLSGSAAHNATRKGVADLQEVSKAQVELDHVTMFAKMLKTAEDGAQSAL